MGGTLSSAGTRRGENLTAARIDREAARKRQAPCCYHTYRQMVAEDRVVDSAFTVEDEDKRNAFVDLCTWLCDTAPQVCERDRCLSPGFGVRAPS